MLIEFSVKNYGCFKDQQRLSLVPGRLGSSAFQTGLETEPQLLPVIAIFGANASGKSTLVRAMSLFRFMTLMSTQLDDDDEIGVTPFLLNNDNASSPSEFEIVFFTQDTLYKYGFSATGKKIYSEWMFMIPKGGRTNELFSRTYKPETGEYDWYINDKVVKGPKNTWRQATTETSLFLSTAVKLNADSFKEPYNWLKSDFKLVHEDQSIHDVHTIRSFLSKEVDRKERVINFIKAADKAIKDIIVEEREIPEDVLNSVPKDFREQFKKDFKYAVKFGHTKDDGSNIYWDISAESGGIKKLFSLAGRIIEVLETGKTLIIDELHNHLHPHTLEYIVSLFQDKAQNKRNAQLVFTSHDLTVLNLDTLGKDQMWFVEKDEGKGYSSRLYSFTSLKSRETALLKAYMAGKLGAVPNIKQPDLFSNIGPSSLFQDEPLND